MTTLAQKKTRNHFFLSPANTFIFHFPSSPGYSFPVFSASLDAAKYDEMVAGHKRRVAETKLKIAKTTVKMAKAAPLVAGLVQQLPELAPKAAPLQAKLDSFFRRSVS